MNQICNYIDLVPLSQVEAIENNTIVLKSGYKSDRILSEVSVQWNETPSVSSAGVVYNQTLRLVSPKLTPELKAKYPVTLPVAVIMYDDQGSHVIGDLSELARITTVPNPDTDSIQIACNRTTPIY